MGQGHPVAQFSVSELRPLIERFSSRRLTVLGDLVADHYVYGQTERVSREAPVLIVRHESSEVKLGGAANVAANVRSLGGQVRAVGVLGKDPMGEALKRECESAGIELSAAVEATLETETKTRILAGGLHTTRQQMLRLDRGNRAPLPAKTQEELCRLLESSAKDSAAILISDYGAGVSDDATRGTLRKLVQTGVPVCVDSRYALREYKGMTVCKPNEPELSALTGLPIRGAEELQVAARRGLEMLECKVLLVTRGRHGAAVFTQDGQTHHLNVHGAREAVDVTGAGDTVIAAFTLAFASGATALQAAQVANIAGGLVVQKQGTATVSREELLAELTSA